MLNKIVSQDKLNLFLILLIPIAFLVIAFFTLGHYGINWDEPYHYRRGEAFLQFLLTGQKNYNNLPKYPPLKGDSDNPNFRNAQKLFEDAQKNPNLSSPSFRRSFYQDDAWNGEFFVDVENSYGHPAVNGVLASLFNKIFYQKLGVIGDLESYHLFIILTVSLTTFFIAWFIWKEFGIIESIFSTLAFASYPLILGEQHFNIKDPVETAFYTITIISAYIGIKRSNFKWIFVSALAFSLGLSTKFNIIFSIIPLTIWFIYFLYKKRKEVDKPKLLKTIGYGLVLTPILAIAVLLISYPTLWKNPIDGIRQIIKFYHEVGYPNSTSNGYYFAGFFNAFPIVWIIYTTPPIVLALSAGCVIFLKRLIQKSSFTLLLVIWLVVAIGRNSLFGALSYGGVRIIMEYIPPLAILSGIFAGYLIELLTRNRKCTILLSLVIFACFIPTLIKLTRIHPNENVYFNFLVGGLSGAKEKNIPYWGDSYGNAYFPTILWLNKNAEMNAKVSLPIGSTSNIPRFKLRSDIAVSPYYWSGLKHSGEYLTELTYDYAPENYFALNYLNTVMTPVYEVKVDNVSIAKLWKNDLEHVKNEYKNTIEIPATLKVDKLKMTLELDIPQVARVMSVNIEESTKNCEALHTGYVISSQNGKDWTREAEDIAIDQLNREEIKKLDPNYQFFFVAREAKTLIFNLDSEKACLLKATKATITALKPAYPTQ